MFINERLILWRHHHECTQPRHFRAYQSFDSVLLPWGLPNKNSHRFELCIEREPNGRVWRSRFPAQKSDWRWAAWVSLLARERWRRSDAIWTYVFEKQCPNPRLAIAQYGDGTPWNIPTWDLPTAPIVARRFAAPGGDTIHFTTRLCIRQAPSLWG